MNVEDVGLVDPRVLDRDVPVVRRTELSDELGLNQVRVVAVAVDAEAVRPDRRVEADPEVGRRGRLELRVRRRQLDERRERSQVARAQPGPHGRRQLRIPRVDRVEDVRAHVAADRRPALDVNVCQQLRDRRTVAAVAAGLARLLVHDHALAGRRGLIEQTVVARGGKRDEDVASIAGLQIVRPDRRNDRGDPRRRESDRVDLPARQAVVGDLELRDDGAPCRDACALEDRGLFHARLSGQRAHQRNGPAVRRR